MGLINSFTQVVSNRKKFKNWEQQDKEKAAKREILQQKQILSDAELKKAAQKGKVIMDVVDIMDTHSEEVAENVETIAMPIFELIPGLATMLSGFLGAKHVIIPTIEKNIEAVEQLNNSQLGLELSDIYRKIGVIADETNDKALKSINTDWDMSSPFSILRKKHLKTLETSQNEEIKELLPKFKKIYEEYLNTPGIKGVNKKIFGSLGVLGAIFVGAYILSHTLGAKLQVKSSRIARWQSRENLKDPKYFVQYTDEQINEAKRNLEAKTTENKKKKKTPIEERQEQAKKFRNLIKDNKKYNEWKENYNLQDKAVKRELSKEETIEAQKDKELIQRITKQINNTAEEYSEDMEVASGIIIGSTPFLGMGIGALINLFINKTGIGDKIQDGQFKKLIKNQDENTKSYLTGLYNNIKPQIDPATKEIKKAPIKNIAKYFIEMISNLKDDRQYRSQLEENIAQVKKAAKTALTTKQARNIGIGMLGAAITGITGAIIGLKMQKASARAGRFKAKQEIENNPLNFIGYTQEDYDSIKNVEVKKETFGDKIKKTVLFLPKTVKEYFEYQKFRKTTAKDDKKLLNELTKLNVTDKQLEDAKNLQRKVFTTFENVDDKSQEYSESFEALTEMTKPVLPYIGFIVAALPVAGVLIKTFKKGIPDGIDKITGFISRRTKFLKGKTSKKILNEVAENIKKVPQKNIAITKNYDEMKLTIEGILSNEDALKSAKNMANDLIENGDWRKLLESMSSGPIGKIPRLILNSGITDEQAIKISNNVKQILNNVPKEDINKIINTFIEEYKKNPDKMLEIISSGKIAEFFGSKTGLKIGGITAGAWGAFSFLMTYLIEVACARMQKNAGKLGVMDAIEELSNDKLYANNEANKTNIKYDEKRPQSPILNSYVKNNA